MQLEFNPAPKEGELEGMDSEEREAESAAMAAASRAATRTPSIIREQNAPLLTEDAQGYFQLLESTGRSSG